MYVYIQLLAAAAAAAGSSSAFQSHCLSVTPHLSVAPQDLQMSQGRSLWLHSSFSPSVLSPLPLLWLFFFFFFPFSPPSPFLCLWSVKYNYPITSHHLSTDWSIALTLDVRERGPELLRRGIAATCLTDWEQAQGYLKSPSQKAVIEKQGIILRRGMSKLIFLKAFLLLTVQPVFAGSSLAAEAE